MRHLLNITVFPLLTGVALAAFTFESPGDSIDMESMSLPELLIDGRAARAHTQGLEIVSGSYYVTARREDTAPKQALLLRTDARDTHWDVWDITPRNSDGGRSALNHPGGMQSDGKRLWIPLAESRRNGTSLIHAYALAEIEPGKELKPELEIKVDDHIGALAVDSARRQVFGASWDTETVYVWDLNGRLERTMNDADLSVRKLGVAEPSGRNSGLTIQDWKVAGERLIASGLFRETGNTSNGPRSRLTSFTDFTSPGFEFRSVPLLRLNETELAREGMAVSDGWIHFLPGDLGVSNRVFRIRLDEVLKRGTSQD